MKILLLGGPRFLGYALIESALKRDHEITLFNRGRTNPDLYPEVVKLVGDRDGGLDVLKGRRWDAVIDTCGYLPRVVRSSAEFLKGAVKQYVFISSISVYADEATPRQDESAAVGKIAEPNTETITGETYGPLKYLCEQAVEKVFRKNALIIRPGLIVGPRDPSDRFTYWPVRIARGGEVLAPGNPGAVCQIIDVRDLADWVILMAEGRKNGVYNATGPNYNLTFADILYTAKRITKSEASFTWVKNEFLLDNQVGPFVEMPLWLPDEAGGLMNVDVQKAIRDGLVFRPVAETAADTLTWHTTRSADYEWRAGLSIEREQELLRKWHEATV